MYATHIGRLGALAVALGVGYAVAPAPAFADPSAPTGADTSSSASASESPSRAGKARASRGAASRAGVATRQPAQSNPSADDGSDPVAPPRAAAATRPSRLSPVEDVNGGNDNGSPAAGAHSASAPQTTPAPSAAVAATAHNGRASAPAAAQSAAAAAPVASAAALTPAPAASSVQQAPRAAAAVSERPVIAAIKQLVSSIMSPFLGNGTGGAPGQSPLLYTALSWVRREFERIFPRFAPAAVTTSSLLASPNLLVNPGAEMGDPSLSGFSTVTVPGWATTGSPTVIQYDTPRNIWPIGLSFPMPDLPYFLSFPHKDVGPPDGGNQFFGGGEIVTTTLTQTVDLKAASGLIDGGDVAFNLSGWLGGYTLDPSAASVTVTFLDDNKTYIGNAKIGPVTLLDRLFATGFKQRTTTGVLPVGTRYAEVQVLLGDNNPIKYGLAADYNDAYADNISFTIDAPLPAPPDPTPIPSNPPALDRVIMVYMENKGYDDIVGSPNAPFLNSLYNAYASALSYYGLVHPSLPNYYPIVGGSDFGLTYNCATPCIDATTTLASNIDAAGLKWRGYAQSLAPGANPLVAAGDYSPDQLPFPAFESIAADVNYITEHVVALEQMAVDLQSVATAPNFAWFAANENFNGEGPIETFGDIIKFVLGQFDPDHQYNVPALDQFLSETVPVVLNSNVWNDPTQKSVLVVTFDEDNDNLSLGIGNTGNHIVNVIIPSQGAIDAGWKGGAYKTTEWYNHYSLLRMINDSLGLPYLSNNDKWANPMNEYWV